MGPDTFWMSPGTHIPNPGSQYWQHPGVLFSAPNLSREPRNLKGKIGSCTRLRQNFLKKIIFSKMALFIDQTLSQSWGVFRKKILPKYDFNRSGKCIWKMLSENVILHTMAPGSKKSIETQWKPIRKAFWSLFSCSATKIMQRREFKSKFAVKWLLQVCGIVFNRFAHSGKWE